MGDFDPGDEAEDGFPIWVPKAARHYLAHTENGHSIRELARDAGCAASTVLRQVRRFEAKRDDPLIDEALRRLGEGHVARFHGDGTQREGPDMTASFTPPAAAPSEETIEREARRLLRRLSEPGACLAVAQDMEKAVVVRDVPGGRTLRTAVVDREIAEAIALKEWIACDAPARVSRYRITQTGRAALKRLLAEEKAAEGGFAEASTPFVSQHRDYEEREIGDEGRRRRVRYNMAESPLVALARREDQDGKPFLSGGLVAAGERLREDFELAQMGPRVTQNWEKFLVGGDRGVFGSDGGIAEGPRASRERVLNALDELGPGLADVVLRCCCFLEGLEATEKRMGWSARSGKIVLRIALQRLKKHYDETEGSWSPMIG